MRPLDGPEERARQPRYDEDAERRDAHARAAEDQGRESARTHEQRGADSVDACYRRETREPRVGLRVTERQPGKSRQKPAPPPLDERPGRGNSDEPTPA